jgi:uncharacterized protein YbaR (Trm112 family)
MISPDFLAMLRCPEDHSPLTVADAALATRLNEAVTAGRLKNRAGQKLEKRLDGALVRADGQVAYPIIDEIPILLVDEGINLAEIT